MADPGDSEIGLDDAYSVDGPDENRDLYARWATTYEKTFIAAKGYVYHRAVAEIFSARFAGTGPVLDVGCGTGAVGVELRRHGVAEIDGIDISAEMLIEARAKNWEDSPVYRRLIEADLTETIDLETDRYAGLVSAGTFTHGHLGPGSINELLRVGRSRALCVIGINSAHFEELGFRDYLDGHLATGRITEYELLDTLIYEGVSGDDPDDLAHVAVFRVS